MQEDPASPECREDAYQQEETGDSDVEDQELAQALQAPSSSSLQCSSESLHTRLTDDLNTKLAISSPKQIEVTQQPTSTATPPCGAKAVIILDGEDDVRTPAAKSSTSRTPTRPRERIELLKCRSNKSSGIALKSDPHIRCMLRGFQLRQEIAKRQQSLACATPWAASAPQIEGIATETLPCDLSPIAKNLRGVQAFRAINP